MKLLFFFSACMSVLVMGCTNNSSNTNKSTSQNPQTVSINNLDCLNAFKAAKKCDSILLTATSYNKVDAENAVAAFTHFTSTCKDDSLAPVFLVKAGQVAQSLGNFTQALDCFSKCINTYDKFKNRGAAMFLLAQLFDDSKMLNNEEEAKKLYEDIVRQYPKTEWATNAQFCIDNLGKTDEELIKEFTNKNK